MFTSLLIYFQIRIKRSKKKKFRTEVHGRRISTWMKKDEKDDQAFYNVCKSSFRIDNSGLSQAKGHASSNNQVSKEKLILKENQRVFVFASDKQMTLSSSSFVLSPTNQITNAEIVQASGLCRFKLLFCEHGQ